jgi:hypothetical protein
MLTGLFLRLSIWDQPRGEQVFDDSSYWTVPDDGFPLMGDGGHHGNGTELEPSKEGEKEPMNA